MHQVTHRGPRRLHRSVVVYFYEQAWLENLAGHFPEFRPAIEAVLTRLLDLLLAMVEVHRARAARC